VEQRNVSAAGKLLSSCFPLVASCLAAAFLLGNMSGAGTLAISVKVDAALGRPPHRAPPPPITGFLSHRPLLI
jgi:hypothetical protein